MKHIKLSEKKVLLRVDFNVPFDDMGQVSDITRIVMVKPTIDYLLSQNSSIILLTHIGRPNGIAQSKYSVGTIWKAVQRALNLEVILASDTIGNDAQLKIKSLLPKQVLMLENLRFHAEEEQGDDNFAQQLARLGNVYINDAYGTAHRNHASTAVMAQYFDKDHKGFGFLMQNELDAIHKVLIDGNSPVTAIIGGSKVSSKITIIENILDIIDHLIIGGGMIFTFIKAKGGNVGNSLVEDDYLDFAKDLLLKAQSKQVQVHIATDVLAADQFTNDAHIISVSSDAIPIGYMGLDIGSESIKNYSEIIMASKTILWNGPMGVFEMSNFSNGTKQIGMAIGHATKNGSFSLVGGGDSVAALHQFNLSDKVSYVSTGGGAMLEALEGIELPGVKAINV